MEQWREEVIKHYNHNHDDLGRFTFSNGPYTREQISNTVKKVIKVK